MPLTRSGWVVCLIEEGDPMRLNLHRQRCPHGRNAKMVRKGVAEVSTTLAEAAEEVEDGADTISSRVAGEATREEEEEEVAEETTVGAKYRAAGRMALVEVDIKVITKIEEVMEEGATMEGSRDRDTKEEEATKEVSKVQDTQEEATKVEEGVSRKEGDTRREAAGVAVVAEEGEDQEEVVAREGDGVEEEGRILTKGGSLSSTFSKVDNSITRRALGREDNTPAEILY